MTPSQEMLLDALARYGWVCAVFGGASMCLLVCVTVLLRQLRARLDVIIEKLS